MSVHTLCHCLHSLDGSRDRGPSSLLRLRPGRAPSTVPRQLSPLTAQSESRVTHLLAVRTVTTVESVWRARGLRTSQAQLRACVSPRTHSLHTCSRDGKTPSRYSNPFLFDYGNYLVSIVQTSTVYKQPSAAQSRECICIHSRYIPHTPSRSTVGVSS